MKNEQYQERINELELKVSNLISHNNVAALQKEMSFREAIERSIPSGIAVVDSSGKQVYVNHSFCRMVGWNEEELLGKFPPYVYWSQEDIENINNALKMTLDNSAPKEGFDLIFTHKTGRSIPVNVIISSFIQKKNETFWLANVIDLSERKQTEEELRKSQLLLKSSIENQKDTIIFSIDKNYHYLYYNKAHADAMKFAYNVDIKIGISFLDSISSDDDRKLIKENVDLAFRGGSHSIIQTFGDTNIGYYEVFFNPIQNDKDEIIGCTSLARNISERVQSEHALKDSETKFKEIINQINDMIIAFDESGKIIIWNRGAEQICGLKAEDVLNKNIADIQYQFSPPTKRDKILIENTINDLITFKTPERFNQIIDSELIPKDSDKIRNIQSTVFPIELNGYYLFCTVIRDVTEIKRYENELLRISADKDKFYSAIAHYMYTPFNTFYNFSKVMAVEMDTLPLKEIQKMAVVMSKSATNLYNLLDNLLQWTKMNQGKMTFKPEKLNFIKTSQDAISILKPNADLKNIRINHFAEKEINVFGDIFMVKTILRNLVSNAIKFTDSDGSIDISAQETPSNVTISVLDNGSGLSPDNLTKLFSISEIHTALDTSEEKGTALGLLLCKEYVEKHGGKIWVERAKGNSSEVKFTMPAFIEGLQNRNNHIGDAL
jgi:PAS domain S-box-containing protein